MCSRYKINSKTETRRYLNCVRCCSATKHTDPELTFITSKYALMLKKAKVLTLKLRDRGRCVELKTVTNHWE